jgi:hypothetical protein
MNTTHTLTKSQKALLTDLISNMDEGETTATIECSPNEYRTAQALERKGLLKIISGRSQLGHFEIELRRDATG